MQVKKMLCYSNNRSTPKDIIDFCKTYMIYDAVRIQEIGYPIFTDHITINIDTIITDGSRFT